MLELHYITINILLLAVFATLVKQKTTINIYRLLKLFVLIMFGFLTVEVVRTLSEEFDWLVLFMYLPMILLAIVIAQTEVRLVLRTIGVRTGLLLSNTIEEEVKTALINSVKDLSKNRIGALITFERAMGLDEYIQTAFSINAPVQSELLTTIFTPKTPLHDGAVIIKGNQIVSAGAYFPPSENQDIPKILGSRHRAAIGISELTDAITIIVSEETGNISVAVDGYLDQDISTESLELYLEKYLQN